MRVGRDGLPATPAGAAGGERYTGDRAVEDAAATADASRSGAPWLQWPLMLVLAGLVMSLAVVASDHFRRGSVLFSGFVIVAFGLRLVLPERSAGWLAVRRRHVDLLCLGALAASLTVFSLIVPPPS